MSKPFKKINRKPHLTAKLTFFDWGWADNIVFKLIARVSDREKGFVMIERIKTFFNINNNDIIKNEKETIKEEMNQQIKWTRDEEGNIVSPFKSKKVT